MEVVGVTLFSFPVNQLKFSQALTVTIAYITSQAVTETGTRQYLGRVAAVARAGDGDALLLTPADVDAALADLCVVPGWQHGQVGQQLACLENLRPWVGGETGG